MKKLLFVIVLLFATHSIASAADRLIINDDSGTTNVAAYVAAGTLYLAYTSPSENDIVVTESFAGFNPGDGDNITGYFGGALDETTTSAAITYTADDAADYVVVDSANTVQGNGTYVPDAVITFNGVLTHISGTPRTSDSFAITPSANQDAFTTLNNLIVTLETPVADLDDSARLHNGVNRFLVDVDAFSNKVLDVRARIGSRLNALDSQETANANFILDLEQTISTLQDLDYASAVSRFNQQLVGLQAAQQAFVRIQDLSLFNFLGLIIFNLCHFILFF